jgi:putative acyl-CoA dehydrogenase
MRQAYMQAVHHASQRSAFGKPLVEQPMMMNLLADLAVEAEAATKLAMRMAKAVDDASPLARIGTHEKIKGSKDQR